MKSFCKLTALFLCVILCAGCVKSENDTSLNPTQIPDPSPDSVIVYEIDITKLQVSGKGEVLILNSYTDKILYALLTNNRVEFRIYDPRTDTAEVLDTFKNIDIDSIRLTGCLLDGYAVYTVWEDLYPNYRQAAYYKNLKTEERKTLHSAKDQEEHPVHFRFLDASNMPILRLGGNPEYVHKNAEDPKDYVISPDGKITEIPSRNPFDRSSDKNFRDQPYRGCVFSNDFEPASMTIDILNNDGSLFESYTYSSENSYSMQAVSYLLDDALVSAIYYRDAPSMTSAEWIQYEQSGSYGRGKIVVEHFSGMHYEFDLATYFSDNTWFPYEIFGDESILNHFAIGTNRNTIYLVGELLSKTVMLTVDEHGVDIHDADLPIDRHVTWIDAKYDADYIFVEQIPEQDGDYVPLQRGPMLFYEGFSEPALYDIGFVLINKTTEKLIIVQPPTPPQTND